MFEQMKGLKLGEGLKHDGTTSDLMTSTFPWSELYLVYTTGLLRFHGPSPTPVSVRGRLDFSEEAAITFTYISLRRQSHRPALGQFGQIGPHTLEVTHMLLMPPPTL